MTIEVEKKSGKAPHLALTHKELQNGSANGRNVSLLMKSDACVTPEVAELIEKLSGLKVEVSVEKASFETLRNGLKQKLLESFGKRLNESAYWLCVEDFDESHVVFCVEGGIYYTSYTLDENGYVRSVGETAIPVHQVLLYKEEEGGVVLSDLMFPVCTGINRTYSRCIRSLCAFLDASKNASTVPLKHPRVTSSVLFLPLYTVSVPSSEPTIDAQKIRPLPYTLASPDT